MLIDIVFPETINHSINCNNLVRLRNEAQQGLFRVAGEALAPSDVKEHVAGTYVSKNTGWRKAGAVSFCSIFFTQPSLPASLLGPFQQVMLLASLIPSVNGSGRDGVWSFILKKSAWRQNFLIPLPDPGRTTNGATTLTRAIAAGHYLCTVTPAPQWPDDAGELGDRHVAVARSSEFMPRRPYSSAVPKLNFI